VRPGRQVQAHRAHLAREQRPRARVGGQRGRQPLDRQRTEQAGDLVARVVVGLVVVLQLVGQPVRDDRARHRLQRGGRDQPGELLGVAVLGLAADVEQRGGHARRLAVHGDGRAREPAGTRHQRRDLQAVVQAVHPQPVGRFHAHGRLPVLHQDQHAALARSRRAREVGVARLAKRIGGLAVAAGLAQRHTGERPGQSVAVLLVRGQVGLQHQDARAARLDRGVLPLPRAEVVDHVLRVEQQLLGTRRAVVVARRGEQGVGQVVERRGGVVELFQRAIREDELPGGLRVATGGLQGHGQLEPQDVLVGAAARVGELRGQQARRRIRIAAIEGTLRRLDVLLPGGTAAADQQGERNRQRQARAGHEGSTARTAS
jgi:hypothetical protein